MENPFLQFILGRIHHFTEESKRLKDRQPLVEYKCLIDTFYFIGKKLGTVEHEVALAKLESELKLAAIESQNARKKIWRDFRRSRAAAIATEHSFSENDRKSAELLTELEKSYAAMPEDDELRASTRSLLDAFHDTTNAEIDLGKGWRKVAWLMLHVNFCVYMVYAKFFLEKTMFFLFRHSFIFLTSILIFGIAYAKASKIGIESLSLLLPQWPYVVGVLTVSAYVIKKYIIDPRLKKLQIKLEARRLRRLAFQLHIVRTMSLVSGTARQNPPCES